MLSNKELNRFLIRTRMRKFVGIAAIIAALIVIGYISLSYIPSPESEFQESLSSKYFFDIVENYPWVKYALRQQSEKELLYYDQITQLYTADQRIGYSLLNNEWIKDYITEEEARALSLLVDISDVDPETALYVSQTIWFEKEISSFELDIMEDILTMVTRNIQVARNVTSSNWFFVSKPWKMKEMITLMKSMPEDLAHSVSETSWFKLDPTVPEKTLQELIVLYNEEKDLALALPAMIQPRDFEPLAHVANLYSEDREMADTFFQYNSFSRGNFITLSCLSRIAESDRELAYSLAGELTQDKIQIIASLADIYDHSTRLGAFAGENFGGNRVALRYLQKVLEVEDSEPELLERVALFVSVNPEFVYEDRLEPYRYHLLTQIISEFPLETAQVYKNLIAVTCSVYGSRFYMWQNTEYGVQKGWSSDGQLFDLEKEAVMNLVTYLVEKNEEGALVTDLRMESSEYLYGVLDIPFTHVVNYDGTAAETSFDEVGTSFVLTTIYNINTLEDRYTIVKEQLSSMDEIDYTYRNPAVDLIMEEGEERDFLFLYFCARNWETGICIDQTLHTRMDSIAMGISTTSMHWAAPDSAHVYPAYIPTTSIAEKLQADPDLYGDIFIYRGFMAPYDEAGFKDYLDKDIETVTIYDQQAERKVGLYSRADERAIYDEKVVALVIIGICILLVIVADTFRTIV